MNTSVDREELSVSADVRGNGGKHNVLPLLTKGRERDGWQTTTDYVRKVLQSTRKGS
jgi:hypothetical protein